MVDSLAAQNSYEVKSEVPAVLFLVFNRPQSTALVFDAIRNARPARLYVAADGPRNARAGEDEVCSEVRRIATDVDWPCEIKTHFREYNLGCSMAVSGAIDWFFQNESEGIILEDDCLPDISFFRYAGELLDRFRNDQRIMAISAQHFHGDAHKPECSYFFSRYNHCWGWACWQRSWQHYDHGMLQWPELRNTEWLLKIGNGNRLFQRYWTDIFDKTYAGQNDTWDYRWTFSCWTQNGLTVLPARNLVTNIGFGNGATHTTRTDTDQAALPLESMAFPMLHPEVVARDTVADCWTDKYHHNIKLSTILKLIVKRVPGVKPLVNALLGDMRISRR